MGCVASSEEDQTKTERTTLDERKANARTKRKEAGNLVHNLVREKFGRDVREFYDVEGDVLGEGIQGVVRTVISKQTRTKYAMKTVPLGAGKDSMAMKQLRSELELIRSLDHPNIVRIQDVFETEDSLFLIMDLCTGGDMMSRWERNRKLRYSEDEAAVIIRKILHAVRYCHRQQVVHRDLKLENLLWEHPGENAEPQLVDFGLGVKFTDEDEHFREDVGSLYYVAPEVLNRNYTKACDCWSIGVITFMLLSGMPPFVAPSDEGVKIKIKWARVSFPPFVWQNVSDEAKDFIKKMLVKTPTKRMSADEACAHPWITKHRPKKNSRSSEGSEESGAQPKQVTSEPPQESTPLDQELIVRLRKFGELGKLKRVALGVIAHSLTPAEVRTLRDEFQKVDVEGRGVIRPMDLQKALDKSDNYTKKEVEKLFEQIDLDNDGTIGFTEFVAASLREGHIKDENNLREAFDRLDVDDTGKLTLDNLLEMIGSNSNEEKIETEITDEVLYEALCGDDGDGLSYDMFKRAMVKSFSVRDINSPRSLSTLVRATSKLSIEELARVTGGSEEDAGTIIKASHAILQGGNNTDPPKDVEQQEENTAEPSATPARVDEYEKDRRNSVDSTQSVGEGPQFF